MDRFIIPAQHQFKREGFSHPAKVTSLIYLKEALAQEAYEECDELIAAALQFGATPEEITETVEEHVTSLQKRNRRLPSVFRRP